MVPAADGKMSAVQEVSDIPPPQAGQLHEMENLVERLEADVRKRKRQRNVTLAIVGVSGLGLAAWLYWSSNKTAKISVPAPMGYSFARHVFDMSP